jgi:hypothetical protein
MSGSPSHYRLEAHLGNRPHQLDAAHVACTHPGRPRLRRGEGHRDGLLAVLEVAQVVTGEGGVALQPALGVPRRGPAFPAVGIDQDVTVASAFEFVFGGAICTLDVPAGTLPRPLLPDAEPHHGLEGPWLLGFGGWGADVYMRVYMK